MAIAFSVMFVFAFPVQVALGADSRTNCTSIVIVGRYKAISASTSSSQLVIVKKSYSHTHVLENTCN